MPKPVLSKDLILGQNYVLVSDAWGDGVNNVKLVMKYIKMMKDEVGVFYKFRINKRSSNWKTDEFSFYVFSRMGFESNIDVSYEGRGRWSVNGRAAEFMYEYEKNRN